MAKAHCPICKEDWHFNSHQAVLTKEGREDLQAHGDLNIICENCSHKEEEIERAAEELETQGRVLSFVE